LQSKSVMIGHIFKYNSNKFLAKTALKYGNENLSYRELDYQTDKLAIFLRNQNIKSGSIVGIKIINPVLYVKCIIALVKIGAVYVPFDSLQPLRRIEKMCSEANVRFILYDKINSTKIYSEAQDIQIPDDYISLTQFENFRLDESTNVDSPMYIMFTSGSTGGPKGVIIPNRGVIRLVCETNYLNINSNDVLLQLSSLSFDASTFEIWGAFLNGATLYLIDRTFELEKIQYVLKEQKISILFLTARLFDKLVDHDVQMFSGVRALLFGGEAHSFIHVNKAFEMLPDTTLLHCYGPTENTTFTTVQKVSHWNIENGYIPIGKAISETQCYVLDENLNILNDNEPGILYISGKGLALGYTDKKLTEQKFIFHPALNERLYNTGDKVTRHPGFYYQYLSRTDRQIKISGFRVELFEIEIEIEKCNLISKAVVIFNKLFENNEIAAFYTTKENKPINSRFLREFLEKTLPQYSIPSFFFYVTEFPLNTVGKIDTEILLKSMELQNPKLESVDEVDSLKIIWSQILKLKSISDETNFFESGGDSLAALSLIWEVEKVYKIRISTSYLNHNPNFKDFKDNLLLIDNSESVMNLKKGEDKVPIYFIPYLNGDESTYIHLAKYLDTTQALYSFKNFNINESKLKEEWIRLLAESYCNKIISVHNPTEIILCGSSFGGILAWEMFFQLKLKNINVKQIHLFDSPEPGSYLKYSNPSLGNRLKRKLLQIKRIEDFFDLPKLILRKIINSDSNTKKYSADPINYFEIMRNYKTNIIDKVPIFLYRSHETWRSLSSLGWSKYAANLDTIFVNGSHTGMLEPENVRDLAEKMNRRLNKKDQL